MAQKINILMKIYAVINNNNHNNNNDDDDDDDYYDDYDDNTGLDIIKSNQYFFYS